MPLPRMLYSLDKVNRLDIVSMKLNQMSVFESNDCIYFLKGEKQNYTKLTHLLHTNLSQYSTSQR